MDKIWRTHTCNELREQDVDKKVTISGWVAKTRITKFAIFIDVRDYYGITQVVCLEQGSVWETAKSLSHEDVVRISGKVVIRKAVNNELATGGIEIIPESITISSKALNLPFEVSEDVNVLESLRLEYRYLDLRRKSSISKLKLKHQVTSFMREYLNKNAFLEVDTPCLTKPTPEGARDFIVPSRLQPHNFYALPQSPQLFKQILMASGVDRYYQIAKCFRDEDFRADRQPEFQQVDIECAFSNSLQVRNLVEQMMQEMFTKLALGRLEADFPILNFDDVMNDYGSDKPDLRCTCKLVNLTTLSEDKTKTSIGFVVNKALSSKELGELKAISLQHNSNYIQTLISAEDQSFSGSVAKLDSFSANQAQWLQLSNLQPGQTLLLVSDTRDKALSVMGAVRNYFINLVSYEGLHPDFMLAKQDFKFLWVINWPMFMTSEEGKWESAHHPFTNVKDIASYGDVFAKDFDWSQVKADAYDLVLNGYEVGGGSIRINDKKLQYHVFNLLSLGDKEINDKFGFFLRAFDYGLPPHGGIALGLDRLLMVISKSPSIRDFIAFPKNNEGKCLLTQAPGPVDKKTLDDLHLAFKN